MSSSSVIAHYGYILWLIRSILEKRRVVGASSVIVCCCGMFSKGNWVYDSTELASARLRRFAYGKRSGFKKGLWFLMSSFSSGRQYLLGWQKIVPSGKLNKVSSFSFGGWNFFAMMWVVLRRLMICCRKFSSGGRVVCRLTDIFVRF